MFVFSKKLPKVLPQKPTRSTTFEFKPRPPAEQKLLYPTFSEKARFFAYADRIADNNKTKM